MPTITHRSINKISRKVISRSKSILFCDPCQCHKIFLSYCQVKQCTEVQYWPSAQLSEVTSIETILKCKSSRNSSKCTKFSFNTTCTAQGPIKFKPQITKPNLI